MIPSTSTETLYSEILLLDKPWKGSALGGVGVYLHQIDREMLQNPADWNPVSLSCFEPQANWNLYSLLLQNGRNYVWRGASIASNAQGDLDILDPTSNELKWCPFPTCIISPLHLALFILCELSFSSISLARIFNRIIIFFHSRSLGTPPVSSSSWHVNSQPLSIVSPVVSGIHGKIL